MRTKIIYLLLIVVGYSSCSEDTIDLVGKGSLTGNVVADATNEPLPNVRISTNPASTTVFTDVDGKFTISPIGAENYSVQAELEGYITAFEAVSIENKETSNVAFELALSQSNNKAPLTPVLLSPQDEMEGLELSMEFVWTSSSNDKDVLTYELDLRNATTGSTEKYTIITDTTLTLDGLQLGSKYFWQVSVNDGFNAQVQSAISEFSTNNLEKMPYIFTRMLEGNSVIFSGSVDLNDTNNNKSAEFQLTNSGINSFRPRFNNDAGKIAFLRTIGGLTHLFTMNTDGTEIKQITNAIPVGGFRQSEIDFTWAQSGTKIYYPNFDKLYSIDFKGGGAQLVYQTTDGSLITEIASTEFDDNIIAVKTNNNSGYNVRIFTLRLSSGAEENVVLEGLPGAAGGLDLDANGDRLIYTRDLSGSENNQYRIFQSRLFIYNLITGISTQLETDVDTGENDLDPRWSPSEREIILTRQTNNLNAEPAVYQVDLDTNNNNNDSTDDLLFSNAAMPDWEE